LNSLLVQSEYSEDSEEEEGKDWDELEAEARRADKLRDQVEGGGDEDDRLKSAKRKGGGGGDRGPPSKKRR
jgi:hypothetical protein